MHEPTKKLQYCSSNRKVNKMMRKCSYILACFAALSLVSCGKKRKEPIPLTVDQDITIVTQQIIADMMKDFSASLMEWKYPISIEDIDMENTLNGNPTISNYSVEYGKIEVTSSPSTKRQSVEISCEFFNMLQVRVPLPNYVFKSYFSIAAENSMPIEYKYAIAINNGKMIFNTAEPDPMVDESTPMDDNSRVNITYDPITINLEMPENNEYSAYEEINDISKKIRSSLVSVIREKLTSIPQSHDMITRLKISQICTAPKHYFKQKYRAFLSEEQQQRSYYLIQNGYEEPCPCALVNFKVNSIKLKGLLDFVSVTIKQLNSDRLAYRTSTFNPQSRVHFYYDSTTTSNPLEYDPLFEFSLQIDNVTGEINWDYSIQEEAEVKLNDSNFTITRMSIEGYMHSYNHGVSNIHVTSNVSLDRASNNGLALFDNILLKRIKTIIQNNLQDNLRIKY